MNLQTFPNAWTADAYGLTETASGDTFLDRDHVLSKIESVGKPPIWLKSERAGKTTRPGSAHGTR